jgi:TolB-like protein/DNA-binding winged helix-turn-helix (wHTH) protein/Flp pilus assembly protein TadD
VPASVPSPSRLRFENLELDLRSGEVWKHGSRVRLQDQPFQVLRTLLERRGEVVTRDELKQKLWPGNTIVDFDDGLNTAVKKIRDLLGDSAEQPRYIETIPRRGYRFIATEEAQPGQARSARRRWLAALLAMLAVALAFPASKYFEAQRSAASVRAIAVLPVENLSGDPAQEYFAAGLTDALTTEIARTVGGSVRVISRISAEKYRAKPLAEIARELDVDAVIRGSVIRSGSRARITAQLVNAREDQHLWAASYDRELHDILNVQGEIAAAIAHRVQVTVNPRVEARLAAPVRVDPQAYDFYQRGRYRAFSNNPQDLAEAIDFLEKAIQLEPNLARARALLARAYVTEAFLVRPQAQELEAKAIDEVDRALKLDPDLADAYLARGLIHWTHRQGFPHERAILDIKRAIELDPNLAEAHHWLGTVFAHVGLLEKAEQELRTALLLEPTNIGIRYRIAINLLRRGKLQEGMAGLQGTRSFAPALWTYAMAEALFQTGRKEESAALIRDYLRDNPRDEGGVGNAMQALLHADAGNAALAEQSIEAAVQKGKDFGHFHHAAYTIGGAYALMNRPQEAVRWLRAAADDGLPNYPLFERDRSLDGLRGDPNFQNLMVDLRKRWLRYKEIS